MKRIYLGLLICLAVQSIAQAQPQLPAPDYQTPITVVTQNWFGAGAPTFIVPGNKPGDTYLDQTNNKIYICQAPWPTPSPACMGVAVNGWALIAYGSGSGISTYTVSTLPVSPTANTVAQVTDGTTATDCTTGSGTVIHLCTYNNGSWIGTPSTVSGSSGVTSVATGSGLSGGPITSTGTVSCQTSTSSQIGCAEPDNVTITATAGVYGVPTIVQSTSSLVILGIGSTNTGLTSSTIIGPGASGVFSGGLQCSGVGYTSLGGTALGNGAEAGCGRATAIGYECAVLGAGSVGVGTNCTMANVDSFGMGTAVSDTNGATSYASGVFGNHSFPTANGQVVFGGDEATLYGGITDFYIGPPATNRSIANSSVSNSLNDMSINAAGGGLGPYDTGNGNNVYGSNLHLNGGKSTGNAVGGSLIFGTSPAGSSGASQNALVTRLTIDSTGAFTFAPLGTGVGHFNSSGLLSSSAVALTDMATQAANTVLGNYTAGSATPTAGAAPSGGTSGCSGTTDAVTYTTSSGWGCHQISGGGSTAFSSLTSSTNTTAAMVVGTGASLAVSGSGTISATNTTAINGTALSGLATGILKNTTTTGVPSIAVSTDLSAISGVVLNATNAFTSAGSLNLSSSTVADAFRTTVKAGFTAGATGSIGFDSTAGNYHGFANSADTIIPGVSGAVTNGHCVQWTVVSSNVLLSDTGSACGSGGGGSAFSSLTSGTNTTATMVVGSGATLGTTGTGTITATAMPLSGLTASVASTTIANGDNPFLWNSATTTSGRAAFTIGETTASTSAGTPYNLVVKTVVGSTATPLEVTNSLNGSQTLPALTINPTWNTTGVVDAALLVNPTNTASGAASKIIDAQIGGTSQWNVDKSGNVTQLGSLSAGASAPALTGTGIVGLGESTGQACASSAADCIWANSAAHVLLVALNQSTVSGALTISPTSVTANNIPTYTSEGVLGTGITPASGIATWLATPSGANLTSALTTPLTLAGGGTNAVLTASNGGIVYSTASAAAILAGTATANQVLLSGSSAAPAWSTATYLATMTSGDILYVSSTNVMGQEANITIAQGGTNATSAAAGTMPNATSSTVSSWTATPTLGASGTIGTLAFGNATSGLVTLGTVAGALGTVTASLPANTGTIAEINLSQTFSNTQTFSGTINISGTFQSGGNAMTFPGTAATLARTDAGQTFTGTQVFSTPIALTSLASTVVNATSPVVGLCHFAGSTQTCTSSAVSLTADVSGVLPTANIAVALTNQTSINGVTVPSSLTSGGVLYASSTSTEASSALLAASIPVFGGGAGVAPVTGLSLGSGSGTANKLACATASNTMGNCSGLPSNNFLGVFNSTSTYTPSGIVTVTLDATVNVTYGDIICASTTVAADGHDNGSTPCTSGEWIGVATTTASSVSSATVSLRLQ